MNCTTLVLYYTVDALFIIKDRVAPLLTILFNVTT